MEKFVTVSSFMALVKSHFEGIQCLYIKTEKCKVNTERLGVAANAFKPCIQDKEVGKCL